MWKDLRGVNIKVGSTVEIVIREGRIMLIINLIALTSDKWEQ